MEVAPEIYKALAEAEAERRKNNGKSASTSSPAETVGLQAVDQSG